MVTKMIKKIVIGCLLSVFVLMMLPSIPALEFNIVKDVNEERIYDELQNMDIKELIKKIKNIDIDELKGKLSDNPALPQCFAIPYAIIALVILCVIFGVLGAIGVTVGLILSVIISLIVGVCKLTTHTSSFLQIRIAPGRYQ